MSTDAEYLVEGVPRSAGRHVCLPELLEQVRFRFDISGASLRLTDSQITYLLNRSREKLFKILVEYDDTRLRKYTDLVTVANQATVAMPERLYAPVRLAYVDSDSREREIPTGRYDSRRLSPSPVAWPAQAWSYYATATDLVLSPTPTVATPLKFIYVGTWPDMEPAPSDFECWDGVQPGWDEWVLFDTLIICALRSRRPEDVALFKAERDELTASFMSAIRMDGYEAPQRSARKMDREDGDEDDC